MTTFSAKGLWLRVRPFLGRSRRRFRYLRRRLSVVGTPVRDLGVPSHPRLAKVRFWSGAAAELVHQLPTARMNYTRAVGQDTRFPEWHYRLGTVCRRLGDWTGALSAYESALALDDGAVRYHFWNAVALCRAHLDHPHPGWDVVELSPPAAIGRRTASRRLMKDMQDAAETVAMIARWPAAGPAAGPDDEFWLAVAFHNLGELSEASIHYERAIDKDPTRPFWYERLAQTRRELGDWKGASDALGVAASLRHLRADTHGAAPVAVDVDDPADVAGLTRDLVGGTAGEDEPRWVKRLDLERRNIADWPGVVALYRSAIDCGEQDPRLHYWLGVALANLEEWSSAHSEFVLAVVGCPTNAAWWNRLASVREHLGDLQAAAEALRTAVEHDPSNAARHARLAGVLQQLKDWEGAALSYERAIELRGPTPAWIGQLGAVRRRQEDWAGVVALYRWAIAHDGTNPRHHFWLGVARYHLEDWSGAIASLSRAIELEPNEAMFHYRLGLAHERVGPPTLVAKPDVGLVPTTSANWPAAERAFRTAAELEPGLPRHWYRLGLARERLGDFAGAAAALTTASRLAPTDHRTWYQLGRCIAATANRRGAYQHAEHTELDRVWTETLRLFPGHAGARINLTRSYIRTERWSDASDLSWYPPPVRSPGDLCQGLREYMTEPTSPERVFSLSAALERPFDDFRQVPHEWWFPLHWCLITHGHFSLAYRAKAIMAQQLVASSPTIRDDGLTRCLDAARARTHLRTFDEAVDFLQRLPSPGLSDEQRLAISKLEADVRLTMGELDPHIEMLEHLGEVNSTEAEKSFRSLIAGRHIAIVGPADSTHGHGAEIDSFDVVIRTKFIHGTLDGHAESVGSRTDVSYYALHSASVLDNEIQAALRAGHLTMAVFRTAAWDPVTAHESSIDGVRFMPSEYLGGYRAAQFGIQRIIYDVLRYEPASVKIFNINFFVAGRTYREGYVLDTTSTFESQGLRKMLTSYGHDFLSDFVFTKTLHGSGLLDAARDVERLLKMTPDDYLRALDARAT